MPTAAEFNQNPTLVRLGRYGELSVSELETLIPLVVSTRSLSKGAYLYHEGDQSPGVYLLLQGWTVSSMSNTDGKRQLLKIHLRGDLIGLPGLPYTVAPDSVSALTPCIVGLIGLNALWKLFQTSPRLATILFMISQEERLMLMDRLFLVGRQDAIGRLSGLILQLHARLLQRIPDMGDTIELPLTQKDCADLLGITTIHMNRTLIEMKRRRLLTWSRSSVILHDKVAMRQLAGLPERTLAHHHTLISGSP